MRKQMKFPPFCDIIKFTGFSENKSEALKICENAYNMLSGFKKAKGYTNDELKFFAPVEAPLFKLKNKYRYNFTVKADKEIDIVSVASKILKEIKNGLTADIM